MEPEKDKKSNFDERLTKLEETVKALTSSLEKAIEKKETKVDKSAVEKAREHISDVKKVIEEADKEEEAPQ